MAAVVAAQGKVGPITWLLLVCQLTFMSHDSHGYRLPYAYLASDMIYDLTLDVAVIIKYYVARSAPNKHCLGLMDGLNHGLTAIARGIGLALTTMLSAISKEYNIFGGNSVYVIMAIIATFLVMLPHCLPELTGEDVVEGHH